MRLGSKPLNAARSIRKQFADAACQGLHRKRLDENVHAWGKKPEPDGPVSQSRGGLLGQKAAKAAAFGRVPGHGRPDRPNGGKLLWDGQMESKEEYQGRVASAILKAIADTSLVDIDGTTTAYIRSAEVCDALITALAVIMEGAPQCRTRKGMRAMSEAAGRNLLIMMREMQKLRIETGASAFNATVIYPS